MGLTLAAFMAGKMPATVPALIRTTVAPMAVLRPTVGFSSILKLSPKSSTFDCPTVRSSTLQAIMPSSMPM